MKVAADSWVNLDTAFEVSGGQEGVRPMKDLRLKPHFEFLGVSEQ